MRHWMIWMGTGAIGLAIVGIATGARGQEAPADTDTDAADTDTDEGEAAPEPVPCEPGTIALGALCVDLPQFVGHEPGPVTLGSPEDEPGRTKDEPLRQGTVDQGFSLSVHEVTQGQFEAVIGDNPSAACGAPQQVDHPVACVSWNDAVRFCNRMSEMMGLTPAYTFEEGKVVWDRGADGLRLPTEAEWELAARRGLPSLLAGGDLPGAVAWYRDNAGDGPRPVGELRPTVAGVHDLSGNVAEWVWDGYAEDPAEADASVLDVSLVRVQKGGSYADPATLLRVAARDLDRADTVTRTVGFRLARTTDAPAAGDTP